MIVLVAFLLGFGFRELVRLVAWVSAATRDDSDDMWWS